MTVHLDGNDTTPLHVGYQLWRSEQPYTNYNLYDGAPIGSEADVPVDPIYPGFYEIYGLWENGVTAEVSNRVGVFSFIIFPGN